VGERTRREQAQAALTFLERGLQVRGPAAEIVVEMANIRLRALRDREGAARLFRQAAELPGAPYYAARIHGELLRELGRPAEALAWLRHIQSGLPENDPAAQRAVVLARIKGLEQEVA
jgi:tetratricopeptide (TPR) repeat protein